jgi:hypothetical protein
VSLLGNLTDNDLFGVVTSATFNTLTAAPSPVYTPGQIAALPSVTVGGLTANTFNYMLTKDNYTLFDLLHVTQDTWAHLQPLINARPDLSPLEKQALINYFVSNLEHNWVPAPAAGNPLDQVPPI